MYPSVMTPDQQYEIARLSLWLMFASGFFALSLLATIMWLGERKKD